MIFLYLIPTLMVLLATLQVTRHHNSGRHARCLANIARLERELGIGITERDQELRPGAVWYIDEDAPEAAKQWGIEHGMVYKREMEAAIYYSMAQRGLSYSSARADWAGALQRYQFPPGTPPRARKKKTEWMDDA